MAKKTLFIHIGTPKTGTTVIQNFCEHNKKILEENGIYYPVVNGWKHWGGYAANEGNYGWYVRGLKDKHKELLCEFFSNHDKVLLSSECIWGEVFDKVEWLNEIINTIPNADIKIIVYLRNQADYFESLYREIVKIIGLHYQIKEIFLKEDCFVEVKKQMNYYNALDPIASVIGKHNIIVRPYEKTQFLKQISL